LFVTEPFDEAVELGGRLRGELDFTINKYDVDLVVMLYELRSHGEYVKLFEPAFSFRASYARDRVRRRLLMAGVRQQLPFQSDRMVGRQLQAGSRLVLVIGVNKRADQQINYGAGNDVSAESIEDAGAPLRIRWHQGSFIEIPFTATRETSSSAAEPRSVTALHRRAAMKVQRVHAVFLALRVARDVPRHEALERFRRELDSAAMIELDLLENETPYGFVWFKNSVGPIHGRPFECESSSRSGCSNRAIAPELVKRGSSPLIQCGRAESDDGGPPD
jgi:hypothetical protein